MNKRWCMLCYHKRRNINGIIDVNQINYHYETQHSSERNEWPITDKKKSYQIGYTNNKPHLIDDIVVESQKKLESKYDSRILLFHEKTEQDITDRIQWGISYVIAWFGKPIRSAKNNYDWSINTLWTEERDKLFTVRIIELIIPKYKELREYLESEYSEIMDDIFERTPKNVNNVSFKDKSLRIIREIKKCGSWSKLFIKYVGHNESIQNEMDLETLKELIDSNKIKTAKEFCNKLMLIWNNAQKYNPQNHKIHKLSIKCEIESKRLIRKYFGEIFDESQLNNNPLLNDSKFAIIKYRENGVRECLLCSICHKPLCLILGFDKNCALQFNSQKYCNQCHRNIKDTSIAYYHCIEGGNNCNNYLCEICAANHYNSKQIKDFPFYGLWIDLCLNANNNNNIWYEAIIMEQDANRIFYQLIFSSNKHFGETAGTIIQCDDNELIFEIDTENVPNITDFTRGKLTADHSKLRFVDICDSRNEHEYKKVTIKCNICNGDMLCMMKDRIQENKKKYGDIICDVHEDYYEKNKEMEQSQQCLSFNAFKYDHVSKNRIHDIAFYFTCTKCKNFDICAGCILIKMEQEFVASYQPIHSHN